MNDRRDTRFFLEDYVAIIRKSIAFFGAAIRRHILAFLLIITASCAAGIAYWYTRVPYYESDLVCKYINQPTARKIFGEMAQKLNLLAQSGARLELARQLGLQPEQAATIIAIESKNRSGSPLYEDITEDYQPIYLTLKAIDNKVFAPAQAALVRYLSNSDYQRKMAAVQVARYSRKIDYMLGDVHKVDSITEAFTTALRNGAVYDDSNSIAHRFDIRAILDYKDALEEKLINLERQRTLDSGVSITVIHGFAAADRPTKGSKKIIAAFAIIGLLMATGLAVLKGDKQQEEHA